jgi:uncharacterized protein (TIGR00251 family)
VLIEVWLKPRSSRDRVGGEHGGALEVFVTVPPVAGRANAALTKLLARRLNRPPGALEIVKGASSRRKFVLVRGLTAQAARAMLGHPDG